MRKVVLCGGGTGGHVFPSIAVGKSLKKENCDLYYIGVNGKLEEKIAEKNDIDFYGYDFSGLPRKLQKELFIWPVNLLNAVTRAKVYLKHFQPDVVFGTGGYSAAPVFIAAKRLNIPYIVHNLDVRIGLANRFCASGACAMTLGFNLENDYKIKTDVVVTGNPVRKKFFETEKLDKSQIYKEFNFDPGKKVIFVIGGSQGASAVNEATLDILKELVLNQNVQIIHQTGDSTYEALMKRTPAKVSSTTRYIAKPFFEDPEKCYSISDLIVGRAGAMTVTEIEILGKPAIFIPYPFAGNHQEANVTHLVKAGGAFLLRQKEIRGKVLLNKILELLKNNKKLNEMSKITKSFAKPDAVTDIVNLILSKTDGGMTRVTTSLSGVL